jgi:hypothetical protein
MIVSAKSPTLSTHHLAVHVWKVRATSETTMAVFGQSMNLQKVHQTMAIPLERGTGARTFFPDGSGDQEGNGIASSP